MGPDPRPQLAELKRAYPERFRKLSTSDELATLDLYIRHLCDLDPGRLAAAVDVIIRTDEFFPTVARIREVSAELELELPSEAEALRQVQARTSWAQRDEEERQSDPTPEVHPVVREAVDRIGGYFAIRAAENPAVVLGQFGRIYRDLRTSALHRVKIGDLAAVLEPGIAPLELTA